MEVPTTSKESPDGCTSTQEDVEQTPYTNNPLQNEVVVRKVLSYLSLEDLKSCRLVETFWNKLSIPYLKRLCGYVSFNNDNYWTNIKNHGIEDVARFIECVNESSHFPYVRLDVGTSIRQEPEDETILAQFFKLISPSVTEIMIRDEWGQNLFNEEHEVLEQLEFASLKAVTLHFIQSTKTREDVGPNFKFITKVLSSAPVLEKLVLIDHNGIDGSAVTYFLEAITAANCLKISTLEIAGQIEDSHLIYLSQMHLKLKTLYLDFWGSMIHQDNLKCFLQSQNGTLERLKIADFAMSSNFTVEFPCMKNLKSLLIKGSVLGRICISFPSICYSKQFPALKRLSFSNAMDEWDEFLKFGMQPVNTVEELKLPGDFADDISLLHAARVFPNIRLLEISANLGMLNIVYESMPNVEELILNTKYVDLVDDIITGLNISECQEIRYFSEEMFQKVEHDHMEIISTKPVSSLKRLKILRLKCKRWTDPVELTDVSCQLVLLKMTSLQCLDFWGRHPPPTRVSPNVLNQMKSQFTVLC